MRKGSCLDLLYARPKAAFPLVATSGPVRAGRLPAASVALEFAQDVDFQAGMEMPRSAYTTIAEIAAEQHGYVTQQDARRAGIAASTLARMAERGTLVRTSHGVYRVPLIPAGPLDQYMEATLWPRGVRAVLSGETALSLHELSDVNPTKIHITVPRAHRPQRETPALYVVHRADLREDEITEHEGISMVTPVRRSSTPTPAGSARP